jgi:hypothetical protein
VIYADTVISLKMAVCWDVGPCSLVETDRRFRGSCHLHHEGHKPDGESRDH